MIDQKLQLELIPYRSPAFATSRIKRAGSLLEAHVLRLLSTSAAAPRDYVIFCGAIFDYVLSTRFVERDDYEACLLKRDGTRMRQRSRFTLMTLRTDGRQIQAGIAQSWARRGMPMDSCGAHPRGSRPAPARARREKLPRPLLHSMQRSPPPRGAPGGLSPSEAEGFSANPCNRFDPHTNSERPP